MLVHAFAGLGSVLFLPLWCRNEDKELFNGWGQDFFSPLLAFFPFFCFKYRSRFFFVNSCLSRSYRFHSHRVSLAGPNFCRFFFAVSLFLLFIYFAEKFVSLVQFCSFICRIAYCFVFPKFRLCSHRVI